MKHDERIMVLKNQRAPTAQPQSAHPLRDRRGWLPRWAKVLLIVALSAAITYWLCDNVLLSRVPTDMLGKWEVTEGELEGYMMEFFRNGTMRSQVVVAGGWKIVHAKVHVADDMLETTLYIPEVGAPKPFWERVLGVFLPESGQSVTVVQRIMSVTPAELVIEDEDGRLIKMIRVR